MSVSVVGDVVVEALRASTSRYAHAAEAIAIRPAKVVVGGGGPGALATANLLREAGADVVVALPGVKDARRGSVMLHRGGWDALERAGGGAAIADAPLDDTGMHAMASIGSLERTLAAHADQLGVKRRPGFAVVGVTERADGVTVHGVGRDGGELRASIDADWYVDATGGASPVANSEVFRREPFRGEFGALPVERPFLAVRADAMPDRPMGWTAADGSFAINDVREGVLTAYRGHDVGVRPSADARTATKLLAGLDVDPATVRGEPWSFVARQSLARSAGQGRILIVGDGAGTVLPVTQKGMMLALTDAERAARTIVEAHGASADDAAAAVARYDEQTRRMHRLFLG